MNNFKKTALVTGGSKGGNCWCHPKSGLMDCLNLQVLEI